MALLGQKLMQQLTKAHVTLTVTQTSPSIFLFVPGVSHAPGHGSEGVQKCFGELRGGLI